SASKRWINPIDRSVPRPWIFDGDMPPSKRSLVILQIFPETRILFQLDQFPVLIKGIQHRITVPADMSIVNILCHYKREFSVFFNVQLIKWSNKYFVSTCCHANSNPTSCLFN